MSKVNLWDLEHSSDMWTGTQPQLQFLEMKLKAWSWEFKESTWSSSMTLMIMNVNGVPHEMTKESTASGSTSAPVSKCVWVSLTLQRCDKPKIPPAHILLMNNDRKSFKSNEPNEPDLLSLPFLFGTFILLESKLSPFTKHTFLVLCTRGSTSLLNA